MFRKRQFLMLPALLLLLAQSWASSFSISPIMMDVPAPGTIATYRVTNNASAPVTVQVSVWQWQQRNGQDEYREETDILIVPMIAEIAPGQSQAVRIASPTDAKGGELAYRVHFQEVPDGDGADGVFLRTQLRIDVPLFFSPEKGQADLDWSLATTRKKKQVAIGAINGGNKFQRFDAVNLVDESGDTLASMRRPFYVLSESNRIWLADTSRSLASGETVRLLLEQYGSVREQLITVQ